MTEPNYRRRRRFTLLILGLLLGTGLWWGYAQLSQFRALQIHEFRVIGAVYCPPERIQALCAPYRNQNVITTFLSGRLKRRLKKAFPQAQKIAIWPLFPSVLQIKITEKTPFITLAGSTEMVVVAQDGTALQRLNPACAASANLGLVVRGIPPRWAVPKVPPKAMVKLVTLVEALQHAQGLDHPVIVIHHLSLVPSSNRDDIVILKDGILPIKMGSLDQTSQKLAAAALFITHHRTEAPSKNIGYIDVRVPHRVIVNYGF